jgi:hypothetical protein
MILTSTKQKYAKAVPLEVSKQNPLEGISKRQNHFGF